MQSDATGAHGCWPPGRVRVVLGGARRGPGPSATANLSRHTHGVTSARYAKRRFVAYPYRWLRPLSDPGIPAGVLGQWPQRFAWYRHDQLGRRLRNRREPQWWSGRDLSRDRNASPRKGPGAQLTSDPWSVLRGGNFGPVWMCVEHWNGDSRSRHRTATIDSPNVGSPHHRGPAVAGTQRLGKSLRLRARVEGGVRALRPRRPCARHVLGRHWR